MTDTPPHYDADTPWIVVLNRGSGHAAADERVASVKDVLTAQGRTHQILVAARPAELPSLAARAVQWAATRGGAVVAAGGDGTLNTVAHAVLNHTDAALVFGALPQGTFNYFGRTHGLPLDLAEGVKALLDATPQATQLGRVRSLAGDDAANSRAESDRVFLVNASLGMYPALLEEREEVKRRLGRNRLVALGAGLVALLSTDAHADVQLTLAEKQQTLRTRTLFVGNNALQLEALRLPEAQAVDQGRLAALVLRPVGRLGMLALLARAALGRLANSDDVIRFTFEHLTVTPRVIGGARVPWRRDVKLAIDGEIFRMRPPLRFEVAPRPLYLLKPRPRDGEDT